MLSRAVPLLRSPRILPSLRSLHKGVDSTPPLRFFPMHEKHFPSTRHSSSSPSFLTPSKAIEWMQLTDVVALNSPYTRDEEGCVVFCAQSGHKISYGWNRPTRGMEKSISNAQPFSASLVETEEWANSKYPYMLHAEQDALIAARKVHKGPKIVYTTLHPCHTCAKHIVAMEDVPKVIFMTDRLEGDTYTVASAILARGKVTVEQARSTPDNMHLQEALEVAKKSPDTRTKVGCVILCAKTMKVIGTGYNRPSKGYRTEDIDWNASRRDVPNSWIDSTLPYQQRAGVLALVDARDKSAGPFILFFNNHPGHETALIMAAGNDVSKVVYRIPPKGESQKAAARIMEKAGIESEILKV